MGTYKLIFATYAQAQLQDSKTTDANIIHEDERYTSNGSL